MRRNLLLLVLACACAVLGLEVTFGDAVETGIRGALPGLPLRVDFTLAERARAEAAPLAESAASEAPVGLKLDVAMADDPEGGKVPAEPATQPASVPAAAPSAAPAAGAVRLDLLARTRDIGEVSDAFGAKSWVVVPPPPPAAPPPPPAPPRAPPLPFRFMGQINDGTGKQTFFLVRGTASLSVAQGEKIDNTYLLERADGGVLVFNYLPLQERQSLTIGVGP